MSGDTGRRLDMDDDGAILCRRCRHLVYEIVAAVSTAKELIAKAPALLQPRLLRREYSLFLTNRARHFFRRRR